MQSAQPPRTVRPPLAPGDRARRLRLRRPRMAWRESPGPCGARVAGGAEPAAKRSAAVAARDGAHSRHGLAVRQPLASRETAAVQVAQRRPPRRGAAAARDTALIHVWKHRPSPRPRRGERASSRKQREGIGRARPPPPRSMRRRRAAGRASHHLTPPKRASVDRRLACIASQPPRRPTAPTPARPPGARPRSPSRLSIRPPVSTVRPPPRQVSSPSPTAASAVGNATPACASFETTCDLLTMSSG